MRSSPVPWMGVSFAVALSLAAGAFAAGGEAEHSVRLAMRLTARWSFFLFWLAYAGRSAASLFGPPFTPLAGLGRLFGLAFAAALLVHLMLVVWLSAMLARLPLSGRPLMLFSVATGWTCILTVLSFRAPNRGLRHGSLRFIGMNTILLAFARDFVPATVRLALTGHAVAALLEYAPFAVMTAAAPLLVIAARRRAGRRPVAA